LQVTIDPRSGFCFGVVYAIGVAERELAKQPVLYCLGDIVHNGMEVERLRRAGLRIIGHEELKTLRHCKVLIRAHGEPPETYATAFRNHIELIDASCPIVLNLQNAVGNDYNEMLSRNGQVVIYGKQGHAEVNGLNGQAGGNAIIISGESDLDQVDFGRPVRLFSQTTMPVDGFDKMVQAIRSRMEDAASGKQIDFVWNDTICRQVSNRSAHLHDFAGRHDVIIFAGSEHSSNGKVLYKVVKEANPKSHFIAGPGDLEAEWFRDAASAGVCGATSTPMWLMEDIEKKIEEITR